MMKLEKLYAVVHAYDQDTQEGPYQDYDVVAVFPDRTMAEVYVEKWQNRHDYDYSCYLDYPMECGQLQVWQIPGISGAEALKAAPQELDPDCSWAFDRNDSEYSDVGTDKEDDESSDAK